MIGSRGLGWNFLAIEKNPKAYGIADKIVKDNNLEDQIRLEMNNDYEGLVIDFFHRQKPPKKLLDKEKNKKLFDQKNPNDNQKSESQIFETHSSDSKSKITVYDALICNPPFYQSFRDFKARKKPGFTSKPHEIIYEGGEVAFARRILAESEKLKSRVRVFALYLSEKSSMFGLKREIRKKFERVWTLHKIMDLGVGRRFLLAWGFFDDS